MPKRCFPILNMRITRFDGIEAFNSYHSPAQSLHYYEHAKEDLLFLSEKEMLEQLERLL